ncbi:hypothetical protein LJR030_000515 [Rhizobium sp. LjRoot30]|uniref:hypothetical protein n=1 Tax=Rhizobium sp. LjRoot30 TaxID=3342320 RepID=UPI003ECD2276
MATDKNSPPAESDDEIQSTVITETNPPQSGDQAPAAEDGTIHDARIDGGTY